MAAIMGQLLEIIAVPELAQLYDSTIRNMQPAELLRRLVSENVSTRGHMPELRGRLLRLEAMKLHPELEVPWYPEDFAHAVEESTMRNRNDDLLNKFFRVTRYQETQLRGMRSRMSKWGREETRTNETRGEGSFDAVLDNLNEEMKEYLMGGEQRMDKPALDSSVVETRDEIVDESEYIVDFQNRDEAIKKKINDELEYKFDANLDTETRRNINDETESGRSSDSIAIIGSDQESFENVDEESTGSWDKDSWSVSSTSSVYMKHIDEADCVIMVNKL